MSGTQFPPPIARLGIIGDLHAEHERLDGVLDWFAGQPVDALVCTGDIADGRGSVDRCCAALDAAGVFTVAGNHDRWLLEDRVRHVPDAHRRAELHEDTAGYLRSLPRSRRLETARGPLLLCHGVGDNDLAQVWPGRTPDQIRRSRDLDTLIEADEYRFLVNGHMHFRVLLNFRNLTLLNGGTLKGERAGVTVLDFLTGSITVYTVTDGRRPERLLEQPLDADPSRPVWRNTREFDGRSPPVTLYP